jgi:hypothetical protein
MCGRAVRSCRSGRARGAPSRRPSLCLAPGHRASSNAGTGDLGGDVIRRPPECGPVPTALVTGKRAAGALRPIAAGSRPGSDGDATAGVVVLEIVDGVALQADEPRAERKRGRSVIVRAVIAGMPWSARCARARASRRVDMAFCREPKSGGSRCGPAARRSGRHASLDHVEVGNPGAVETARLIVSSKRRQSFPCATAPPR